MAPSTIIELSRLALAPGDGVRLEVPARLDPFELGGQTYRVTAEPLPVALDVSRPTRGYAFRLSCEARVEGPCMRCLEPASLELEVEAREVDQAGAEDPELRSPYVEEDTLDVGRWARDATLLALPARFLCRPDCAGLCPVCGQSLNDADPAEHEHGSGRDPRWAALDDLKLE